MLTVEAGGMTGFLHRGEDGALDAPLLVCVHGGGCNGRYFDLPGFSVASAALRRGFAVLAVNRPGHGGSAPPTSGSPIVEAAARIPAFVERVRRERLPGSEATVMLGHSIGGAVVLTVAAGRALPLRAIAVSGVGGELTESARPWLHHHQAVGRAPEPPLEFFFGREGSFDWRGPAALRRASEPWLREDALEVMRDWPQRFESVAARTTTPVHFRLAEHETIWRCDPHALASIAARFTGAPSVDCGLLPEGGHLYEIHRRGPEAVDAQLDFLASFVDDWVRP